jgi:hypothetical protein
MNGIKASFVLLPGFQEWNVESFSFSYEKEILTSRHMQKRLSQSSQYQSKRILALVNFVITI